MSNSSRNLQTIESHVLDLQRLHPSASGDFTSLLNDISFAAKVVSREVNKAGLVDILGATGGENVQGEVVQKLDEYANNVYLKVLGTRDQVCIMGSEGTGRPGVRRTDAGHRPLHRGLRPPRRQLQHRRQRFGGHHLRHLEASLEPRPGVQRGPAPAGNESRGGRLHHLRLEHDVRLHRRPRGPRLHPRPEHRRVPAEPREHHDALQQHDLLGERGLRAVLVPGGAGDRAAAEVRPPRGATAGAAA